ncbi:MAG: protein translocase subunit SecD [Xanthomonadales bacterium]|nr:protein translocase subunit SecD [Xanthomonadales bacterium]
MIDYPKWKFGLVALVLLLALLFALPNLFPQEPAVQISANRGNSVDQVLEESVKGSLQGRSISYKSIVNDGERLLIRFTDTETQLLAADAIKADLRKDEKQNAFVVALNLASTVPDWLRVIGADSMPLGLDLQGGVHFLMEVDQRDVTNREYDRYVDDVRASLREQGIDYLSVTRAADEIDVELADAANRSKAELDLRRIYPDLRFEPQRDTWLKITVPELVIQRVKDAAIQQNLATLRNRINELGVAEPVIQQQGSERIVVQLPGVQDTARAKNILGATATLSYHAVDEGVDPIEAERTGRVPFDDRIYKRREGTPVVLKKRPIVTGEHLVNAQSGFDSQSTNTPMVSVKLNSVGAQRMLDFTEDNVGRGMAVVYVESRQEPYTDENGEEKLRDVTIEEVISVATIQGVFSSQFQTTGLSSKGEADELALLLRAGSLAAPVRIVEERVVGPSIGRDNVTRGVNAVLVGLIAVMVFAAIYYKLFGLVANIGLVLNLVCLIAVLSIFGATLTMPGIAAILLTLGMAIDANVLISERVREELRNGSTPLAALRAGYDKAWTTILDANVTTLIATVSLIAFASGPIRGFAITLSVGLVTTMFTAVAVTRALMALIYRSSKKPKTLSV